MPAPRPVLTALPTLFATVLVATGLAGCTTAPTPDKAGTNGLPTAATTGPDGYWTIAEVPPSPYPAEVPEDPTLGQEDLIGKYARENGLSREQAANQINGPARTHEIVARIAEPLRSEPNYVEMRMVRDPAVRMEVWFTRDAAETLAKYTTDPLFVPREGGWAQAEQERQRELWLGRMQQAKINSLSVDSFERKVEIGVGTTEGEFLRLARLEGWDLAHVKAHYAGEQPAAFADPAISRWVKAFAREDTPPGARNQALLHGRIVLDDGCFRLADHETGEPGKLVMFAWDAQLALDPEGYLSVVGRNGGRTYRIGEAAAWGGPNGIAPDSEAARKLRAACGDGEIVNVANPESTRLFSLPFGSWVTNYAQAKGMTRQAAWEEIIACMKREEAAGRRSLDMRDACIRQFN